MTRLLFGGRGWVAINVIDNRLWPRVSSADDAGWFLGLCGFGPTFGRHVVCYFSVDLCVCAILPTTFIWTSGLFQFCSGASGIRTEGRDVIFSRHFTSSRFPCLQHDGVSPLCQGRDCVAVLCFFLLALLSPATSLMIRRRHRRQSSNDFFLSSSFRFWFLFRYNLIARQLKS